MPYRLTCVRLDHFAAKLINRWATPKLDDVLNRSDNLAPMGGTLGCDLHKVTVGGVQLYYLLDSTYDSIQ